MRLSNDVLALAIHDDGILFDHRPEECMATFVSITGASCAAAGKDRSLAFPPDGVHSEEGMILRQSAWATFACRTTSRKLPCWSLDLASSRVRRIRGTIELLSKLPPQGAGHASATGLSRDA